MKRIVFLLVLPLLFCGCGRRAKPVHRVVTGIQVRYQQQDEILTRTYTKPASIQSVLTYLRILRPLGPVIPDGKQTSTCQITLQYSQGPDSVFLQQGYQYLRRDDGAWKSIDNTSASLLYPLLLLLPSDG